MVTDMKEDIMRCLRLEREMQGVLPRRSDFLCQFSPLSEAEKQSQNSPQLVCTGTYPYRLLLLLGNMNN